MYTMKQAAEKVGLSVHTLRFYTNEGLFPNIERDENGIRYFTNDTIEYVYIVKCLRDTGMTLTDIKEYIKLCTKGKKTILQRYDIILKQKKKAQEGILELNKCLEQLEKKEKYYKFLIEGKKISDIPEDLICNPKF